MVKPRTRSTMNPNYFVWLTGAAEANQQVVGISSDVFKDVRILQFHRCDKNHK